jgi:hypothetical protein
MHDTQENLVTATTIHAAFANESEQLSELVEEAIEKGDAEALYGALALCENGQKVSELFWEISNIASSVFMESDAAGEDVVEARLFLIPVLFMASQRPPDMLTDVVKTKLSKSLRKFGLINDNPAVIIRPEVLSVSDVPDLLARRQLLNDTLLAVTDGKVTPLERDIDEEGFSGDTLCLRFIAGVVIGGMEEVCFDLNDELEVRFQRWAKELSSILTTKKMDAHVLPVVDAYHAVLTAHITLASLLGSNVDQTNMEIQETSDGLVFSSGEQSFELLLPEKLMPKSAFLAGFIAN